MLKTVNVDDKLEMLITDFYIGKVADIMKLSPLQARFAYKVKGSSDSSQFIFEINRRKASDPP